LAYLPDDIEDVPGPSTSTAVNIKKVNSQVNVDEKTGKVVSTSASTDCDLATNINVVDNKVMTQKVFTMQASSSLPDLQKDSNSTPSSTATISSNSNNQMQMSGHGKHVILAVESQNDDDNLNQMNGATGGDLDHTKKKIKLNIDLGSSSSASSNNLEYENGIASNPSTL
jgi:hypothetical protein